MPDEPTLGELHRQMAQVTRQLQEILAEIRQDRRDHEQTYVRRETYDAHHASITRDLHDLETAGREDAKYRRQTWTAIGLAFIVAAIGLMSTLIQGGGVA